VALLVSSGGVGRNAVPVSFIKAFPVVCSSDVDCEQRSTENLTAKQQTYQKS
jgi:hypothetical protein